MKRLFKRRGEYLSSRVKKVEKELESLRNETKSHKEIETFYISMIRNTVREEVAEAVEMAFQNPIEMTQAEIEKAFGHKIKIVARKE